MDVPSGLWILGDWRGGLAGRWWIWSGCGDTLWFTYLGGSKPWFLLGVGLPTSIKGCYSIVLSFLVVEERGALGRDKAE